MVERHEAVGIGRIVTVEPRLEGFFFVGTDGVVVADATGNTQVVATGPVASFSSGPFCVLIGVEGTLACALHARSEVQRIDDNVRQLSAAAGTICALGADGGIRCMGNNYPGGDNRLPICGQAGPSEGESMTPIALPERATEVRVLGGTSCARLVDGRWMCWGQVLGPHGSRCVQEPVEVLPVPVPVDD